MLRNKPGKNTIFKLFRFFKFPNSSGGCLDGCRFLIILYMESRAAVIISLRKLLLSKSICFFGEVKKAAPRVLFGECELDSLIMLKYGISPKTKPILSAITPP